jgi:O-methyltransferase involved in polyketide biosynthesis
MLSSIPVLAGDIGKKWIESRASSVEQTSAQSDSMIDKFAVRTKTFDDFIKDSVVKNGLMQVCVIGAGLDTRFITFLCYFVLYYLVLHE